LHTTCETCDGCQSGPRSDPLFLQPGGISFAKGNRRKSFGKSQTIEKAFIGLVTSSKASKPRARTGGVHYLSPWWLGYLTVSDHSTLISKPLQGSRAQTARVSEIHGMGYRSRGKAPGKVPSYPCPRAQPRQDDTWTAGGGHGTRKYEGVVLHRNVVEASIHRPARPWATALSSEPGQFAQLRLRTLCRQCCHFRRPSYSPQLRQLRWGNAPGSKTATTPNCRRELNAVGQREWHLRAPRFFARGC
jgi:hypothetical protein